MAVGRMFHAQVHVLFRHGDRSPMPLDSPSKEQGAMWESRLQPRPSADVLPVRQHTRGLEYPFGQLTVKGMPGTPGDTPVPVVKD